MATDADLDQFPPSAPKECLDWMEEVLTHLLRIDASVIGDEHVHAITKFLQSASPNEISVNDVQASQSTKSHAAKRPTLFAYLAAGADGQQSLVLAEHPPTKAARRVAEGMNKDVVYFVMTNTSADITGDNIHSAVTFGVVQNGNAMDAFLRAMTHVFAPTLLNNQSWPESIQREFNSLTHKFMATLTETANRMKGSTVFYVPLVGLTDEEYKTAHQDKELVQTFITAVIYWTKQIRDVVHEKDTAMSESAGPLTEIDYWRARAVDLRNICAQINRPDVTRIIDALIPVKDDSKWGVDPFLGLKETILTGMNEAVDNLRYLKTLEPMCRQLATATPAEIPDLVKPLLQRVQLVFMHAKYYKKERFFRLLRMISNEIVSRCRSKINLNAIFDGDVHDSMIALEQSITAGRVWISQCNKMLDATRKQYRFEHGDSIEKDESIFNEISNFVQHRCPNLQEVCRGQLQFGFKVHPDHIPSDMAEYKSTLPCFGGAKGPEMESQLVEIQNAFRSKINSLRNLDYDILDVKATAWSDDFRQFKSDLEALGMMVTQVIQSAFDLVATVETGAEMLEAFFYLAKQESIENAVQKRQDGVVALFKRDLAFVLKEHTQKNVKPFDMYPSFAADAYLARSFRFRIETGFRLINRLWYLDQTPEKQEAYQLYQHQHTLDETVRSLFRTWKEQLPTEHELHAYLEMPILAFRDVGYEKRLIVNFPVGLQLLFEEARYWSRLGESVPPYLQEFITQYEDRLRVYRENVAIAVRVYNDIVAALEPKERELFVCRIAHLETPKVYGNGWEERRQTWGSKGIVDFFVKECRIQADKVQQIVDKFKHNNKYIAHLCRVVSDTLAISFKRKTAYHVKDFEEMQATHIKKVREKLHDVQNQILENLLDLFEAFRPDYKQIQGQWHDFVKTTETSLNDALKTMVKKSLSELSRAVGYGRTDEEKNSVTPIFILEVKMSSLESSSTDKPRPIPTPSEHELRTKVTEISTAITTVVEEVNRIETSLKEALQASAAIETDDKTKLPPVEYEPPSATAQTAFHSVMADNEAVKLLSQPQEMVDAITSKIHEQINLDYAGMVNTTDPNDRDGGLWGDQEKYKKRAHKLELSHFTTKMTYFKHMDNAINAFEGTRDVGFVRLDYTKMREELHARCVSWQHTVLKVLHDSTRATLESYEKFEKQLRDLEEPMVNLKELEERVHQAKVLENELRQMEDGVPVLVSKYDVLTQNSNLVDETEQRRKQDLFVTLDKYKGLLSVGQQYIERRKEQFKNDLEAGLRQFGARCELLKKDVFENGPYGIMPVDVAFQKIAEYEAEVKQRREKEIEHKQGMRIFNIDRPPQADLAEVEEELMTLRTMWGYVESWKSNCDSWKTRPFSELDQEEMGAIVETARRNVMGLKKKLENREIWKKQREEIELFKKVQPVIEELMIGAIKDRHWLQLRQQLDATFDHRAPDFCLNTLLDLRIERQGEFISNLAITAKQELAIETTIATITAFWRESVLEFDKFNNVYDKIATVEDINNTLADHLQLLSSMKSSRFVDAFKKQVIDWEKSLSVITETLESLLTVQGKWMYLENIFGSGDIGKTLPAQADQFNGVKSMWLTIMNSLVAEPLVLSLTRRDGLLDKLNGATTTMDSIQKALDDFLKTKRNLFPRFYFLSNDDLLEIIGHARAPEKVQPHLRKCFEGLYHLTLGTAPKQKQIVAKGMSAADGETVPFAPSSYVTVENVAVEKWLKEVEATMRNTVRARLMACLEDLQTKVYQPKRSVKTEDARQWLVKHDGMCTITAAQINWTKEAERVLTEYTSMGGGGRRKRSPVYRLYKKWKILIRRYCEMVREGFDNVELKEPLAKGEQPRKLDTRLQRNKLVALITIEVHSRDILNAMQAARVHDVNSFDWAKQLRFYRDGNECRVRQTSAQVNYDYEYLGNSGRLVVTNLTDRAYMTLTTALQLHRGGLPQGPAGTGKTETVKDLGKAIAKYVMVFNCSDGLDYQSLGRMFSGLAQTGAWSCFDEFNRIEVEVLSVVAQQIFCILSAVGGPDDMFTFENDRIPINKNCGVFVTMNPGYAGRSELPDNLKALLRPISMMVPDFTLICEITLLSQGFKDSRVLAQRVSILYELMEKQLSKQDHYDFSLRNIKAVLVQAGNLKREALITADEQQLCLRACREMNLPKFVQEDVPLFLSMLGDLFPDVDFDDAGLEMLRAESRKDMKESGLQDNVHIAQKVLHFWDTLNTRHGVMVVGQTGSGKTVTWKTLAGALKRLNKDGVAGYDPVKVNLVNPKSVTMDELYGSYNQQTREWKDGILSDMMRQICRDDTPLYKWLLFDGPVDTLWIESMNTVLDDNKMLTLNSGERINLTPWVKMVFEVEDLTQASPATVSRCGMVYFNVEDLGWEPYVHTWLAGRKDFELSINAPSPDTTIQEIKTFIDQRMQTALDFRKRECSELFRTSEINAVRSFTHLLDAIANPQALPWTPHHQKFEPMHAGENYPAQIRALCIFSLMWSVGGTLVEDSRRKFDVILRELEPAMPSSDTTFEYFFDYKTMVWKPWEDHHAIQSTFSADYDAPYYSLTVPTVDTVRYNLIVGQLVRSRIHTALVGNTGTGKTLVAKEVLNNLDMKAYVSTQLNFSAQTTSKNVQDIIEGKMEHPSKKTCNPPGGRRMVCLIEDLNMPAKEKFGAQPPLELLRQWMDNGYWFDRATQSLRRVTEMQLLCCMTFGRPDITPRLLSKLNVLNITFPSSNVISKIFTSILSLRFQRLEQEFFVTNIDALVKATMQVYQKVTTELLPIPSKSHYLFNLRDLSKVFQGIYSAALEVMDTKDQLITLWMHEAFRTFSDRMNDPNDKAWFRTLIIDKLGTLFATKWSTLLKDNRNPVFVDFWDGEHDELAKYKLVPSNAELKKKLQDAQDNYNEIGGRNMNLVFFADAMEHLCRIHRIIRQPRGNALLVGLGGSGRASLTKLAAHLAGYQVFTIKIHKKYDVEAFHEDLRDLYSTCGALRPQQRVFYFSDNQIMHTTFLEDINNMLSVGEVPNLFPKEKLGEILDGLRKEALDNGCRSDSTDDLYNFFIDRARRHLHLVIAMSPAHKDFRLRLRQFPGLVSCTNIDWFVDWPSEALKEVGHRLLGDAEILDGDSAEAVASLFVSLHESTHQASERLKQNLKRYTYVTPSSFLDLVRGYIQMYIGKKSDLEAQRDKLKNGMSKLMATRELVGKMGEELEKKKQQLREQTQVVDAKADEIGVKSTVAREQENQLNTDKIKIERDKQTAEAGAADAQKILDKAMPALDAAMAALGGLEKKDLDELKSYPKAPALVMMTMEGIQILFRRGTTWEDAKKTLQDTDFKKSLELYPKNDMPDSLLNKLGKHISKNNADPDKVAVQSKAAGGLCKWMIAMNEYGKVYKVVAPKQEAVERAKKKVADQEAQLRQKQEKLDSVLATLRALQDALKEMQEKKASLQKEAAETERKMERAKLIVNGLGDESTEWTAQIEYYEQCLNNLVGDVVLASGMLSYAGPFPAEYRDELNKGWIKDVRKTLNRLTAKFDFVDFLAPPTEVRDWENDGLPGDGFSRENGVIVTRGSRWPLMIDPQQQANKWLKKMFRSEGLKVIDPKVNAVLYMKIIEDAVQSGTPVLFQDILDEIDPALDSVVSKAIVKRGHSWYIKIGDQEVSYNMNFKFFMTTRMANPHYTPETCTKVSLLNFAVKEQGLEEQLLKIVVVEEKPELEEQNEKLILESAAAEKEKKRLEDVILDLLAHSDDSLLDNEKLVDTLQTSKRTQIQIKEQLTKAAKTKIAIAQARDLYRPCATRASILFFVLADLGAIDSMYQFALDSYILLFQNSIRKSAEKLRSVNEDINERVKNLNDWHTGAVYSNTCRGLFEKHKLLFSFHMTARIFSADINQEEYSFFMKGGVLLENSTPNPGKDWLPQPMWDNICALSQLMAFYGISESFEKEPDAWKDWYLTEKPEETPLPLEWQAKLENNYMQRMAVVRSVRPDRVVFMVQQFIEDMHEDKRFIEPPPFSLIDTFEESNNVLPLVFVLSPGVDPTTQLVALAEKKGRPLHTLALGQGQGKPAEKLINQNATSGGWVFLANCHLMVSWLQELEKIIDGLPAMRPHEHFRLWLSSTPTASFPIGILQRAIKMTTEPPTGLKANMQRLYHGFSEEHFNSNSGSRPQFYRPLLFALCYFHSILLERRKFGTLGYNVVYDFTSSDFEVSDNIIALYIRDMADDDAKLIPFTTIKYLVAEASYGGRVTDDWDRRTINTYIDEFMNINTVTQESYKLTTLPEYIVPPDAPQLYTYREYCQRLPTNDQPEAFGQHPNADIASQKASAFALLENLMSVNASLVRGGGGGSSVAESVEERCLRNLASIDEQIPGLIDFDTILEQTVDDRGSALNTCLLQEIQRYNALLRKVHRQKADLRRAVNGELVMNDELDLIFNALLVNKVPPPWQTGYPSSKPLVSWTRDLKDRVEQMIGWGRAPPKVFWLSGFTYPTGFLKSLQQQMARRDRVPIDEYGWEFFVLPSEDKTIMHSAKEGAYVRGILLEGAGWNTEANALCEPSFMKLTVDMPIIHFKPKRREGKVKMSGIYSCPMYMYPVRTGTRERPSFVLAVDLATGTGTPEQWTKRGTALLLSDDA